MARSTHIGAIVPAIALAAVATAQVELRPRLAVRDPGGACPSIAGAFVALLEPARGMLLLSGAEFLGGRELARATGGAWRATSRDGGTWKVASMSVGGGAGGVWGAEYPFTGAGARGCVAFDRDRFSSEGDLVTYLRWLVDEVYLAFPAEERAAWPAFVLANREVRLRIEGLGFQPHRLGGREGAAQAFRLPGIDRTYLVTPFIVDEVTGRVAILVSSTAEAFWQGGEKSPLGWVVASRDTPGALAAPPLTLVVETVGAGAPTPPPPR